MSKNNIQLDFAKLESRFEVMNQKLNRLEDIEKTLKEISRSLNDHNTAAALLKQDLHNAKNKIDDIDKRLSKVEKNQNYLLAKVGTITTAITAFIAWIFNR